ncbi:MAG: hypothetical protein ACFHHU_10110 [Porticoccaceae bacterium]
MEKSTIYLLSDGCYPTEDLYFRGVVSARLKKKGTRREKYLNCKKTHPDFLKARLRENDIIIIFRTLPPAWALSMPAFHEQAQKIVYVLDDDLRAAASTASLPQSYRERIGHFAEHYHRLILDHSHLLVVSSRHLAGQYADYNPLLLPPSLLINRQKSSDPNARKKWICYHATRSHEKDLEFVAPALRKILTNPNVGFESLIGDSTPKDLCARSNVIARNPKSWRGFQLFQRICTRHIRLAPLLDSPYNRGKSHIKFLDIAAVGAVGIYSNREPYSDVVIHGENGFLANDDPDEWFHYLNYLISNPKVGSKMARNARETAYEIGHPRRAYRFWRQLLDKN